jgi:hypothetical protein
MTEEAPKERVEKAAEQLSAVGSKIERLGGREGGPLTWRNKEGWPLLAIFDLSSPRFAITVTRRWDAYSSYGTSSSKTTFAPKLAAALTSCYDDVAARLKKKAGRSIRGSAKVGCTFAGLLPDGIRGKLAELKSTFKNIYVIAEPDGLMIPGKTVTCSSERGLIAAGFDGENLWLIDD